MNEPKTEVMNNTNKKQKKTDRKNKTNLVVKWPVEHFTIDTLLALNSEFEPITLRSRVTKAINSKTVEKIGILAMAKGRPKMVLAIAPITSEILSKATLQGVQLTDSMAPIGMVDIKAKAEPTADTTISELPSISSDDMLNSVAEQHAHQA